ncbi:UNKNOWN [Stylonychia lemnae]|uniref:Uncharacterized protein n=1 Tax=Stylonychia lemnae TaxID=5949 RepID=A0A078ACT0_STYLE|nr:UNKNOWN [Stylonychia lemnae]|eukprot:CDW78648.1 UNKNOWN [Stylonychia lemnae]
MNLSNLKNYQSKQLVYPHRRKSLSKVVLDHSIPITILQEINQLIDDLLKLDEETAMQRLQTLGKSNNKLNLFLDFMQTVEEDAVSNLNSNNKDKKLSSEYQETKNNNKRELTTAESQKCRGTTPRFKQESNIDFDSSRNKLEENMDSRKRSNFPGFDLPFSPQPISSPDKMFNYQTQNTIFSIKKQTITKTTSQAQQEKQAEELKNLQQQLIESNEEEILVTESFETS